MQERSLTFSFHTFYQCKLMVESRNRMHTREMFKQLYLKYGASHIRLPVGSEFEDSFESVDKIPEDLNVDNSENEKGEIIGVFSGLK